MAASLLLKAEPMLDARTTALVFDEVAKPTGLVLPTTARVGGAGVALEAVVREQAVSLLESAATVTNMSTRVPWSNAINVLGGFLIEFEQVGEHKASMLGRDLLSRPRWSDSSRSPLHVSCNLSTSELSQRRMCCLRYRLDGFDYRGDCPISSQSRRNPSVQPNS